MSKFYYINPIPNKSGSLSAPQSSESSGLVKISEEQKDLIIRYNGFVTITENEKGEIVIEPNNEKWEEWKSTLPTDAEILEEEKNSRILKSCSDLEDFLYNNPLQWKDGNYYSITRDKQQQLTSKLMAATLASLSSTPYTLKWNTTGETCVEWSVEDLTALAFAIDTRVTSLVEYQQTKEVDIRNASSMEELNKIEVNYEEVK